MCQSQRQDSWLATNQNPEAVCVGVHFGTGLTSYSAGAAIMLTQKQQSCLQKRLVSNTSRGKEEEASWPDDWM